MTDLAIENIRIDTDIGDGISFTLDIHGVAHRFFVTRETLGHVERTLLATNHDMVASFERQRPKIMKAVMETLKLGSSHNVTFLKATFFNPAPEMTQAERNSEHKRERK